jgi:hypothetical protein
VPVRRPTPARIAASLRSVKRLHAKRRKAKVCINNATHGKAYKGGRCKLCWDAKLQAQQAKRKEKRRLIALALFDARHADLMVPGAPDAAEAAKLELRNASYEGLQAVSGKLTTTTDSAT